jgi:hypothetical protein
MTMATLLVLAGCGGNTNDADTLNTFYQRSIAEAAIKRPDYARLLHPIDMSRPTVTLAHIQPYPTIDTTRFIWVAPPDELRGFCRGRRDPLLAMQQALGLPPEKNKDIRVFTFDTKPTNVFRPCASGPEITTTQCSVNLPVQQSGADSLTEHFVLKQMMDSYRSGFAWPGYPFTAMGWSYDWDPESPTGQGFSEYVVKPGSKISNVASVDAATFCRSE